MYAFIEGKVDQKGSNFIVLDAYGVGYEIMCSQSVLTNAPPIGEKMKVFTYLAVRDDAMELIGFASLEEKRMFMQLISVSGIGTRTALSVLSSIPLKDLTLAILTNDITVLSRAPGIGKKTAQRISLELKDKISEADFENMPSLGFSPQAATQGPVSEAILALESLGYTQMEATRAIGLAVKENGPDATADTLVKTALRGMMKG